MTTKASGTNDKSPLPVQWECFEKLITLEIAKKFQVTYEQENLDIKIKENIVIQIIEKIKLKYCFKSDYDLFNQLLILLNIIARDKEISRQTLTPKERNDRLIKFKKNIADSLNILKTSGTMISLIFNKDEIIALEKINNKLSQAIIHGCQPITGRPIDLLKRDVINYFANIYINGTQKPLVCYKSEHHKNGYEGDFFNFSMELNLFFNVFDSPSAMGKYIERHIKKY